MGHSTQLRISRRLSEHLKASARKTIPMPSDAEAILRDMAYVLHLTGRVKEAILESTAACASVPS